jgi:hypothetical protein
VSAVADTAAAAANSATTIPATGIVLVSIVRIVKQRPLRAELVDDQDDDRCQTAEQRRNRLAVEEGVGQQLGGAEERGHAADGRQRDRRQIARRVRIGGRRVVERQHGQDQRADRDRGDDPEQRPPGVRLRLQPADRRARAQPPRRCTCS